MTLVLRSSSAMVPARLPVAVEPEPGLSAAGVPAGPARPARRLERLLRVSRLRGAGRRRDRRHQRLDRCAALELRAAGAGPARRRHLGQPHSYARHAGRTGLVHSAGGLRPGRSPQPAGVERSRDHALDGAPPRWPVAGAGGTQGRRCRLSLVWSLELLDGQTLDGSDPQGPHRRRRAAACWIG